ncbi:hypothetical protein ACFW6E_42170 [Streptomyces olivaceoviridis]|uniref:hypothetical protein n=1 Tax=Streptomyces olivaceoviridis TaxID=1921 RepID=UPI0036B4D8BF
MPSGPSPTGWWTSSSPTRPTGSSPCGTRYRSRGSSHQQPGRALLPGCRGSDVRRRRPGSGTSGSGPRRCRRSGWKAHPPAPVLPNRREAPGWPEGLVGSMTHYDGYRAVALARAVDVIAVGIDAEPNAPLPEGVLETVSLPAERAWISDLTTARAEVS